MANPNAPFGLRPVRHLNGSPYNGQAREYEITASVAENVFIGDVVTLTGDSNATDGTAQVDVYDEGDVPVGVVVGFTPVSTNALSINYHPSSTLQRVQVCDSPDVIFAVMSDGTLAHGDIGLTGNIEVANAGSTVTGLSGQSLDESDLGTSTHALLVIGLYKDGVNAFGANGIAEVIFNTHSYKTTAGA